MQLLRYLVSTLRKLIDVEGWNALHPRQKEVVSVLFQRQIYYSELIRMQDITTVNGSQDHKDLFAILPEFIFSFYPLAAWDYQ